MAETWPIGVPYAPRANSMKLTPFRPPLATDMEDGQQRRRPSTTKSIANAPFVIKMENAEFEIFRAWVRDTLVMGTLPFTMPIWTGSDYANKRCSFKEPYGDDPGRGIRHLVSVNLDIEDF